MINTAIRMEGDRQIHPHIKGISAPLGIGVNSIQWKIPYENIKIIRVEVINAQIGDKMNFNILDDENGKFSQIPSSILETVGHDINLAEKFHRYEDIDARNLFGLYKDMILEFYVTSLSEKTLYINLHLEEKI